MCILMIILAILCWIVSAVCLFRKQLLAPLFSFLGLGAISLARTGGLQIVPVNTTMLLAWLVITAITCITSILQPLPLRQQSRGTGFMLLGAVTGMALGLCGTYATQNPSVYNGIMVIATVAGTFLGYLLFTLTPRGSAVNFASGNFFRYLLSKGFPVAVSVMMGGLVLVLLIVRSKIVTII